MTNKPAAMSVLFAVIATASRTCASNRCSPVELQRHLDFTGRVGATAYYAKAPAIEGSVWSAEPRMIEGIEELRPVLQAHPFPELGHGEFLQQRQIGVVRARRPDRAGGPRRSSNRVVCRRHHNLRIGEVLVPVV